MVSAGRLDVVTASFGWIVGSAPISWRNLLERLVAVGARPRTTVIGTTIFGSSWATSAAARVARERAADRHAGDVDPPDVGELLLGQLVADVAEVDRVDAVELDDERDLLAALARPSRRRGTSGRPVSRTSLDLVLAGTVEHERVLEAGGMARPAVARQLALRLGQRASSGWLNVTTSPVMPRPVGPTTAG